MRISAKKALKAVALALGVLSLLVMFKVFNLKDHIGVYLYGNLFDEDAFRRSDLEVKEQIHFLKYEYSMGKGFMAEYGERINEMDIGNRCSAFFQYVDRKDPEWEFDYLPGDGYEKFVDNKRAFFEEEYRKLRDTRNDMQDSEADVISREDNVTINNYFHERLQKTIDIETKMADTMTMARIFNQCFIKNAHPPRDQSTQGTFETYARKLFPYLTFTLPTFLRFNGTVVEDGFPNLENGFLLDHPPKEGEHMLDYMRTKSNGRGIVISASSRYSKDIVKLIRLLRAHNNRLPIQVVHKGDLSKRAIQRIKDAALSDMMPDQDLVEDGQELSNSDKKFIEAARKYGVTFPKQELWFVDVQPTIFRHNRQTFTSYENKLLAYVFNSFEEILLMDADTVPLIAPTDFFSLDEYKEKSALFFRDRSLRDTSKFIETNFFSKLLPQPNSKIDPVFGVKTVTNHTLNNTFLTGYRHLQEAGIVVINKKKHFPSFLTLLVLAAWNEPVESSAWGDKEMYWLSLSMSGDEDYQFNKYQAASVGQVTAKDFKFYPGSQANEICSSHPGHMSNNGTLLWMNSGFSYCKKNSYMRDKSKFPFKNHDEKTLLDLYHYPLRIHQAIIPPTLPQLRFYDVPNDYRERHIREIWAGKPKDLDELDVDKMIESGEYHKLNPQKGWVKTPLCTNYQYCAYDMVFNMTGKNDDTKGTLFLFDEEKTRWYNYIGSIWLTGKANFYW